MRRKHNLPAIVLCIVGIVTLIGIMILACTGCAVDAEAAAEAPRFNVEAVKIGQANGAIITDTETGELYLWVQSGYCSGLAKMGAGKDG